MRSKFYDLAPYPISDNVSIRLLMDNALEARILTEELDELFAFQSDF